MKDANWSVLTDQQINDIMERLNKLYHDMPMEYCGIVLSTINDIEYILRSIE